MCYNFYYREEEYEKILKYLSLFILVIAQFAAATPSQLGSYQAEVPNKLKK